MQNSRSLTWVPLEDRVTPAVTAEIIFDGSEYDAVIHADSGADITVRNIGSGYLEVLADGTRLPIGGEPLNRFNGDVFVFGSAEDDTLTVQNGSVPGVLYLDGDGGDDTLIARNLSTNGVDEFGDSLVIFGQADDTDDATQDTAALVENVSVHGNMVIDVCSAVDSDVDTVTVRNAGIRGDVFIETGFMSVGVDSDTVTFENSSVAGSLELRADNSFGAVTTAPENDDLVVVRNVSISGTLDILADGGDDTITVENGSVGTAVIASGGGNDVVTFRNIGFAEPVSLDGGDGLDTLNLSGVDVSRVDADGFEE